MYNSYKYHKKRTVQKQIKNIDYRNAKYQGGVTGFNMTRNGHALLLDQNYLFVMANWQNGKIEGPSFVIYPDDSIFYGYQSNNSPAKFSCFQLNKNIKIYSIIDSKDKVVFVVDICSINKLFCLKIDSQVIQQMLSAPSKNKYLLVDQYKKQNGKIKLISQWKYSNQQQKWSFMNNQFPNKFRRQFKSYKQFLRSQFSKQKIFNIKLTQNKKQFEIKYDDRSTILCKLQQIPQKSGIRTDLKVTSLGFYNKYQNNYQIGKKIINEVNQQVIAGQVVTYNKYQKKRPKECLVKLQNYYKRSVTFVNEFIDLDFLYGINYMYNSIEECFQSIYSIRYPQKFLNQSFAIQNLGQSQRNQNIFTHRISLQEVKKDIHRAIAHKTMKKSLSSSNLRDLRQNSNDRTLRNRFEAKFKNVKQNQSLEKIKIIKRKQKQQSLDSQNLQIKISLQKRKKEPQNIKTLMSKVKGRSNISNIHQVSQQNFEKPKQQNVSKYNLQQLTKQYKQIDKQIKRSLSSKAKRKNISKV